MTHLNSGIYKILNTANGKFYIGSSIRLNKRFERHRWELDNNCHSNKILQRSYIKYGADAFEFQILETIENPTKEILIGREQYYIDNLKPNYNILPLAGSQVGAKRSEEARANMKAAQQNKVLSEKAIINIRTASAKRRGVPLSEEHKINAYNGRKNWGHSEETKAKIKAAHKSKSSWPHKDGYKCNCRECLDRKNLIRKLGRKRSEIYTMVSSNLGIDFNV